MGHEQRQLVEEGEAVFRHQLEAEEEHPQGSSNQSHKNVTMFVSNNKIAATAITDRNKLHISPGPKFKI